MFFLAARAERSAFSVGPLSRFRRQQTVLSAQVDDPIVLLVKLFATQLTTILEYRLVDLAMQLQTALGAQALATLPTREAFHMVVVLGVVLVTDAVGKETAAGLAIELGPVVVLLDVVAMGHRCDKTFATEPALKLRLQGVLGPNVIGQNAEALAPRRVGVIIFMPGWCHCFPAWLIAAAGKGTA